MQRQCCCQPWEVRRYASIFLVVRMELDPPIVPNRFTLLTGIIRPLRVNLGRIGPMHATLMTVVLVAGVQVPCSQPEGQPVMVAEDRGTSIGCEGHRNRTSRAHYYHRSYNYRLLMDYPWHAPPRRPYRCFSDQFPRVKRENVPTPPSEREAMPSKVVPRNPLSPQPPGANGRDR